MAHKQTPWEALSPGEQWRGWLETGITEAPMLPVLAMFGPKPGPFMLVTGAVHGDEYEGTAAIHTLFNRQRVGSSQTSEANDLPGLLVGLPVVNMNAWQARSRVSPVDGIDLNRVFPSQATSSPLHPSERLAEFVFNTFVRTCDVLIDLHSGGVKLIHLPMVGWYQGGHEAESLARRFGGNLHPWLIPHVPGVLSCEAHRAGKIALGAEWGGGARLDAAGVIAYVAGVERVRKLLTASGSDVTDSDRRAPISGSYQQTRAGGYFTPDVRLGEQIQAGAPLGKLHDELGQQVHEIYAERNGLIAALAHTPFLYPGDRIGYIG